MLNLGTIGLILSFALASFLGSCGAWIIMNGFVAKRVIRKGIRGYIQENPEEFQEISGELARNIYKGTMEMIHKTYEKDPERLHQAFKPIIGLTVKKVKDHIFSQVGVENKKAKAEAEDMQGKVMEQITGGIVSSELLEEYPLIGNLLNNPAIQKKIQESLGSSNKGSSGSQSSKGLLEQ